MRLKCIASPIQKIGRNPKVKGLDDYHAPWMSDLSNVGYRTCRDQQIQTSRPTAFSSSVLSTSIVFSSPDKFVTTLNLQLE